MRCPSLCWPLARGGKVRGAGRARCLAGAVRFAYIVGLATAMAGCGIYTFSGSTLPGYLKTVEIPLFANRTLQTGIAEDITQETTNKVLSSNLLRVVAGGGDASISGEVRGYRNEEYQYDIKQELACGRTRIDCLVQYFQSDALFLELFGHLREVKGRPG